MVAVVNPHSGRGRGARMGEVLRRELPRAQVVTLARGADMLGELHQAAGGAEVLAVCGGDGTVAAAAQVAIDANIPLVVFPGGTFNHFATDIGIERASGALAALRQGSAIRIDVGLAGERLLLNTSRLGSYPAFVATRERWEPDSPLAGARASMIAASTCGWLPWTAGRRWRAWSWRCSPHGWAVAASTSKMTPSICR